ncbi:ABC-2 type transport system permease protein [Anaerobranca californiensis DSM 14826]|jgi:ABC-2 type transport system permease protein|uniref:ABC-2 type transport system permease protein n=1 Tax=Anaerobranca californiensis DSM 14826 TaxID=1120989 RepID=A0A1M6LE88_9FIRM|nr:hypothetical protein [Anaerobranca californiensis]SHJ69514.1 ABC-2 type transport system permease protein [Anaerobranca californiensis DSM 14826]
MTSFKAYFKKEILESLRQSRYIIFLAGFGIWALVNPLGLKFLPQLIGDQLPQELLDQLIPDRAGAMQNYISDVFSLVIMFVIFPLMGILSDEVGRQRLMLPASKGLSLSQMVLAKSFHYSGVIIDVVFIGFLINYYYTGVLFGDGGITIFNVLQSALLVAIYFIFIISLLLFVSSLVKKGIIAGLSVLVFNYLLPLISSIDKITKFSPYYLFQRASDINNVFDGTLLPSLLTTGFIIVVLNWLAIYRMKKIEVV